VLCLYPGMNPEQNEYAPVLLGLHKKNVKLAVIASRSMGLKGKGYSPPCEFMEGVVPIYRPFRDSLDMLYFPQRKLCEIQKVVNIIKPDLVFCSQELNMPLALLIKRHLNVPIVTLVEDAGRIFSGESGKNMGMPSQFGLFLHRIGLGHEFWLWLCKNSSALITCHPKDRIILNKLSQFNKPVYYIPWPTYVPKDLDLPSSKNHDRGVYIGSLYPFKNTQEFKNTLPRILSETCTKEFIVVGPGPHSKFVRTLQDKTRGAIRYIDHLSRKDALLLIAGSYYAYTPVLRGGWGFIGDCWSMKCPIVMTHNDSYVENNVNALVAKNEHDLAGNINLLYKDDKLYVKLQENGCFESEKRSPESVSDKLHAVFQATLDEASA
jgi:glycosyltransferase involved in cell wall biosynthesis